MIDFIIFLDEWQTLVGAFLGAVIPLGIYVVSVFVTKSQERKKAQTEIESISLMAIREMDDNVRDIKQILQDQNKLIAQNDLIQLDSSIFKQLYINEERLHAMKYYFDIAVSQQIDIFIENVKKLNATMLLFKEHPAVIFDHNLRLREISFILNKEELIKKYKEDSLQYYKLITKFVEDDYEVYRKNFLRPNTVLHLPKNERVSLYTKGKLDKVLDELYEVVKPRYIYPD